MNAAPAPPWERAFAWIVEAEGGFVQHPSDPGGATNIGVSLRAVQLRDHDRDGKLDFDLDMDGDVDEWDIRLVTPDVALPFYRDDYWSLGGAGTPASCADFPPPLAVCLFDAAVLQGPRSAVACLQRALRIRDDGLAGPATVAAAYVARDERLVARFQAERIAYYSTLRHWHTFRRGWAKRMFEVSLYAFGQLELRRETTERVHEVLAEAAA